MAKNLLANAGDRRDEGLIPGSGRSPEAANGTPLQYSCLENSMDRRTWQATVPGFSEWDMTEQLALFPFTLWTKNVNTPMKN